MRETIKVLSKKLKLDFVSQAFWPVFLLQSLLAPVPALAQEKQGAEEASETETGSDKEQTAESESATSEPDASEPSTSEPSTQEQGSSESESEESSESKAPVPTEGAEPTPSASSATGGATIKLDPNEPLPPGFVAELSEKKLDDRKPPSAKQLRTLQEMESERSKFRSSSEAYKRTLVSVVRRDYLRKKRGVSQEFGSQIRREEKLQALSREQAIKRLERFVQRYPNQEKQTPDAMFRLGELYFERSQLAFQAQFEDEKQGAAAAELSDFPDYGPTVKLYHDLATRFPKYRRLDGVYYLIGFCLQEMNKPDEARLAWLNLVCSNQYTYDPNEVQIDGENDAAEQENEEISKHPSLGLDRQERGRGAIERPTSYEGCQPIAKDAGFQSETWFRIGEYHFDDYSDPNALELAVSAYRMILADPADRNFGLALYKVAWAYYRGSKYPEAIRHFARLVDWSDEQQKRTGQAGSELRPEAIQYLGISFAYEDWDENQVSDINEGRPSGFERIRDARLLPQDRDWTPEIYFQLGDIYFEESKYPEAIEVWKYALERWALHHKAPEVTDQVASAYLRGNDFANATKWRLRLGQYREGSEWWKANDDHPKEQQLAEQLAENGVISGALFHHRQAQQMRRSCVEQQDPELCEAAQKEYAAAANGYREYLEAYPNSPQAYELHYNLADALYWSENYESAATEYAMVRDSNLDDKYLSESARRVVESVKRVYEAELSAGSISVREEPPQLTGTQIPREDLPNRLTELAHAREMYIARVSDTQDKENVLEAYDYNNALLLYFYGYWYNAKQRFERIFQSRCAGPNADDTGRVAWLSLRNIAVTLNDTDEVERLGKRLKERQCTFASGTAAVDCSNPENREEPQCLAGSDLVNVRYRRAVELFAKAEAASGDEQVKLYDEAAKMLIQAVNDEPNHPEAPLALEKAAIAYERTNRFESAATLYQRIVDDVGPLKAKSPEEQKRLDAILSNAYFRLAYNANRFFEFERAVENYTLLANSKRFSESNDPSVVEKREDALINASLILEWLQRYPEAARYYSRAANTVQDTDAKRTAYFRLAETAYKRGNWSESIKAMQEFIRRYGNDAQAADLVVKARWRIAQAQDKLRRGPAYKAALREVTKTFARSGLKPGSPGAEYAAEAQFVLADEGLAEYEKLEMKVGKPRTLEAYVNQVGSEIEAGSRRAKTFSDGYNSVLQYRRPTWTIAAFVRQGRVFEVLARATLNTPFVMPSDLQKQLKRVGPDAREDIRIQVEDRIRMVLDEKVRPIECRAVARYALASRAARAGSLDNEYSRVAVDRLQAYGDERIAECIAEARKEDPSFEAYKPGEFSRAPRGQTVDVKDGVAPPTFSSEGSK